MIQKCPHCKTDVIFSKGFCPACGLTSKEEEREEPTYLGEAAHDGRPVYNQKIETTMTETQKRGRTLTGLLVGTIPAPWIAYSVVRLICLKPDWGGLCITLFALWLVHQLWIGKTWARWSTLVLTASSGIYGLCRAAFWQGSMNAVELMGYGIFSVIYLICAWQLFHSIEIREFLGVQAKVIRD